MADQNAPYPALTLEQPEQLNLELPRPQHSTFDVAWSPSKSTALDSSRVQLADHVPRAWERAPHSPIAEDSRFKKVWKSYNLRQQSSQAPVTVVVEPLEPELVPQVHPSPQRPVKKLRTKSPRRGAETTSVDSHSPDKYVATKWERRRSHLPRKQPQNNHVLDEHNQPLEQVANNMLDMEEDNQANTNEKLDSANLSQLSDESVPESAAAESPGREFRVSPPDLVEEEEDRQPSEEHGECLIELDSPAQKQDILTVPEEFKSTSDILEEAPQIPLTDGCKSGDAPTGHISASEFNISVSEKSLCLDVEESTTAVQLKHVTVQSTEITEELVQPIAVPGSHGIRALDETERFITSAESPASACHKEIEGEATCEDEQPPIASSVVVEFAVPELSTDYLAVKSGQIAAYTDGLEDFQTTSMENESILSVTEDSTASNIDLQEGCVQSEDSGNEPEGLAIPRSPLFEAAQVSDMSTPPPLEEATTTMTFTSTQYLEEDKAFLQSFLDRTAASKANRTNTENNDGANCTRRESVQNRRDSDAVRLALASPGRVPLVTRDANVFSPKKGQPNEAEDSPSLKKNHDKSAADSRLVLPDIDDLLANPLKAASPRRSGRSKMLRAATPVLTGPHQIAVRRVDGNDTVTLSLTKTESQLLANETRRNTRKNKGPALSVIDRLVKWKAELVVLGKDGQTPDPTMAPKEKRKVVVWSEELEFLNETTGKAEKAPLVNNEPTSSAATAPEQETVSVDGTNDGPVGAEVGMRKGRVRKTSTPKVRRLRGLGAANGTPAKGVLASTLLPEELAKKNGTATDVAEPPPEFALSFSSKIRIGRVRKQETGISEATATKSRLPPPKKLNLVPSVKSVTQTAVGEGVQNDTMRLAPKAKVGSVKKGSMLPVAGQSVRKMVKRV